MNEILTMNSRSPRRKFVFFCCVTLLKLIDKKTFGINMDSPQGRESKRISLFYKLKLRKVCLLRNCYATQGILFAICVTIYLCWTKSILTLHIKQRKGIPHISFVRFCDLRFVKNRCHWCHITQGAAMLENLSQSFYTFPKNFRKKNSAKLIRLVSQRFQAFRTLPLLKKKGFRSRGNLNFFVYDTYISIRTTQ